MERNQALENSENTFWFTAAEYLTQSIRKQPPTIPFRPAMAAGELG